MTWSLLVGALQKMLSWWDFPAQADSSDQTLFLMNVGEPVQTLAS